MIPAIQLFAAILVFMTELTNCYGPDFSDIRYLGNKGYDIPSRALYSKIYGSHGKRYGVHFPGIYIQLDHSLT